MDVLIKFISLIFLIGNEMKYVLLKNNDELIVTVKIKEIPFDSPTVSLICVVTIPPGRVPPVTIEMRHVHTDLFVKAMNTQSSDMKICSSSIIGRDLQVSPNPPWLPGMSEDARLKIRYGRSYCERNLGLLERNLVVVIDDIKLYDLNRWICEVEPFEQNRQHVVVQFDGLIEYNPFKNNINARLIPELKISVHPNVSIGRDPAPNKHAKEAFTCTLPGYHRNNLDVSRPLGSPFIYVSIMYEQKTNPLGYETGVSRIQSELFTRHLGNATFISKDRLTTTRMIDFLCKDPPNYYDRNPSADKKFSSIAYFKENNLPIVIQPSLERAPLTVCFRGIGKTFHLHRPNKHPLETTSTCHDFFLFGDQETRNVITLGNIGLNTETMPNTFMYNGNLMEIGQLNTPESENKLHLSGETYFTTINQMLMWGKNIEGPRRLVFKMPEQTDIRPIQVSDKNPFVHIDRSKIAANRHPLKIVPSGTLMRDFYKAVAELYIDFADVEAKHIHIWAEVQYNVRLECIGYNGGYARVIYVANGLCADSESPIPRGWCRPKGYKRIPNEHTEDAYWKVRVVDLEFGKTLRVYARPNEKQIRTGGMNCMMNFYFCGRQPREQTENPMIREIIVVEPKIPYKEDMEFEAEFTVTKHDKCLYGQEKDMPFDDLFLSPFHKYYFFNMTTRTFNAYKWANNIGADMLELVDYMYTPDAVRRISFEEFRNSWKNDCPCKPIPSLCPSRSNLFDYGVLPPPNSVGYTTTNVFEFHAKTMPINAESYIWCEIGGVRSPKIRPVTAVTKYLFRHDQTSVESDAIIKAHLSLLPQPKLHVARGSGALDGWIHLSCAGVPHAAFSQIESAISLIFQRGGSYYASVLAIRKANASTPGQTYIAYSWTKLGKNVGGPGIDYFSSNLPLVNETSITASQSNNGTQVEFMLGTGNLINLENGEDMLPVYVNRSLMLYYESVKCSYAYQGRVSQDFVSTSDLINEANSKCLQSEYNIDILMGNPHLFTCIVNFNAFRVEGGEVVNSTCKTPTVHLYTREINSNRLMPYEVTCTHPNAIIHSRSWVMQSGADGSSKHYVKAGDSYCIYEDHIVRAVVTLPDTYTDEQAKTLKYYCSLSEHYNFISKSSGPVTINDYSEKKDQSTCVTPPSYFHPLIHVNDEWHPLIEYQTIELACSLPQVFKDNAVCPELIHGLAIFIRYVGSFAREHIIPVAWLDPLINPSTNTERKCKVRDKATMTCEANLKSSNDILLKVSISDTFFYDITTFTELGYTLQAFCAPNKNVTLDEKLTKLLELKNLKTRLDTNRVLDTGSGPPSRHLTYRYGNGRSQEKYLQNIKNNIVIICYVTLGIAFLTIIGSVIVLVLLFKNMMVPFRSHYQMFH